MKYFFRRCYDVLRSVRYDIVFIQREAYFIGPPFFEWLLKKFGAKIIFDFDDSIWLQNVSDANKKYQWLKSFSKTSKIISYASMVFAGNQYLSDYAANYTDRKKIRIVPTTINTTEYFPSNLKNENGLIRIGWSGSFTTIKHFKFAEKFLTRLSEKYPDKMSIIVIGDKNYKNDQLPVSAYDWKKEDELRMFSYFDIGIMPLPDDEWARGKCGLKGLQYMAIGIPTIMSPVGVNTEIIQDGVNGFLAEAEDEWTEKISLLIESPELRKKIGANGRQTVEERYSFNAWKDKYVSYFEELITDKDHS
ncbi:MAG TPA: glycosyltransferase family 4 protein [Bacteroidales bacterium]|nr:glycosyltransferase family 4 protein [Bacteroidales bacterium]